jgi:large subunit ribosomal protein L9
MKIVLLENIDKLGKMGDIVEVADGYARNYLIPKRMALAATKENINLVKQKMRLLEKKIKDDLEKAKKLAKKLEETSITINVKSGEGGKIFGAVTNLDIAEALKRKNIVIDKRDILLEEPIQYVGAYVVDVRLHKDVMGKVKIWVTEEQHGTGNARKE